MSLPKNAGADKTNFAKPPTASCCLLTAQGPSAVAVIGVRGTDALNLAASGFTPATNTPLTPGQIRYGRWMGAAKRDPANQPAQDSVDAAGESVVVVPLSDQELEIHCHGGVAASQRIIDDLRAFGAESIDPDGWPAGASMPRVIREAEYIVRGCLTARMAAVAMDQVRGALADWCRQAAKTLGRDERQLADIQGQAQTVLQRTGLGLRLDHRFQVVLLGAPNVGKSSLVNAIVGFDRSITMNLAGTTRDVLHADTVVDGVPIRLSDTAGLRESFQPIEREGVRRATGAAKDADLVILVRDPETPPVDPPPGKRHIHVFNKSDLALAPTPGEAEMIPTVATTGEGVENLMVAIARSLAEFPESGSPVPVSQRQADLLKEISESKNAADASGLLEQLLWG